MSHPDQNPHGVERAAHRPADNAVLAGARERVIALLTDRYADETITLEEFEARLDQLHAATSASELNALMRGLDIGAGATAASTGAIRPDVAHQRAMEHGGFAPSGRVVAILAETTRTGRWPVPMRLELQVILGDVLIDLRDAVVPPGGSEIALLAVFGRLRILVPPGVVVDDGVGPLISTVRNDAEHEQQGRLSGAMVRLTGSAIGSEVLIRVAPSGEMAKRAWNAAKRKGRRR